MEYPLNDGTNLLLDTIVLDLNGTLSVKGNISERSKELIALLEKRGFKILLVSGDQRGTAKKLSEDIGVELRLAKNASGKAEVMSDLVKEHTVAIGNARIDIGTFDNAILRIATLQAEGIHTGILEHVDIVVPSIEDALQLLLDKNTLCATMKV